MRYTIILFILVLFQFSLYSQTRRMNQVEAARTYTAENQTRTVQPLLQEAERQFRALDFERSFLTLETAVAQNPNSAEALLQRAKFKSIMGMETEAEQDLEIAMRLNPYVANLYGYNGSSGLLKILAIAPEQAIESLNTLQKLNYYYQNLDHRLITSENKDIELQKVEEVMERIEENELLEGLEKVEAILEVFPNSAIAYDLKGIILDKQEKQEAAMEAFFKAVEIEPNFAIGWYNLGRMERSRNNFEKARIYLDKAIGLQKDLTKAYFERALLNKQTGKKENAVTDYNTIISMNGNMYMEALLNRGLTKKMVGDYGGALEDLDLVIEAFPNNAELRKNRGNLRLLFNLHRKAIDDYTKAIALDANYAEAHYNRGVAFFIIYDKISGCADLEKSAALGYERAEETSAYFCTN